jgi:hypothetical protein
MSLLTIGQNIANQTGVLNSPGSIIGNTDQNVTRLLGAAQRAGKELAKEFNWTILQKETTVATSATSDYAMPSDFLWFITQTQWDRTNLWQLIGPTSPVRWQQLKSGVTTSGPRRRFRVKPVANVNRLFIDPTPGTTTNTLAFEYISKNWCQSAGGTGQSSWLADTDTGILDEDLLELGTKWQFLAAMRLPYLEEKNSYERYVAIAKANDGGMPILSANMDAERPDINLPDINFTL